MYNDGSINISYQNGDLRVFFKNSSRQNITGKVKPSCEGYITFADNKRQAFEFNEEVKEIVWYGSTTTDKWTRGCFHCVMHNLFI